LSNNKLYGVLYFLIVGFGIYASIIFYTYIKENYLQKSIPAPVGANEVYNIPLEDINGDFWMYNTADINKIRQLLGNEAIIAPVTNKQIAVQAELIKQIISGISYSPNLKPLFNLPLRYGSQFSDNDQMAKRCILSFEANSVFFQGINSIGKSIYLNGEQFEISGVATPDSLRFLNIRSDDPVILIPESQFKLIDQDLNQNMYYSTIFVKSKLDRLTFDRLYRFINEKILPERDINKRLRSITTLERYIKEQSRNRWVETLLLLFIVSFGFFTSLAYQISLSILFNLNRIKNTGIELLLGASYFGVFIQILFLNLILSSLGLIFSFILAFLINKVMIIAGFPDLVKFNYSYLYLMVNVQIICVFIATVISLVRVKAQHALQIIQK
jgi:hypothetical protein